MSLVSVFIKENWGDRRLVEGKEGRLPLVIRSFPATCVKGYVIEKISIILHPVVKVFRYFADSCWISIVDGYGKCIYI